MQVQIGMAGGGEVDMVTPGMLTLMIADPPPAGLEICP